MARPSVSSQSLVDLASSKIQSKKETKGYDEHNPAASSFSDHEITQEPIKNKGLKNKQEQHKNIELIRKKYTLQNKSLAKNNSLMMLRISEMEAKVSDLINENMLLRKRRTYKDAELKKQLESKLVNLETGLMHKFSEIFEMLKGVRMNEGIPENPRLDVFKNFVDEAPSATSTPIEEVAEIGNSPFLFNTRPLAQPLKDDSFTLPKSHLYLHTADKGSRQPTVTERDSIEERESDSVEMREEDKIDPVKDSSVSNVLLEGLENTSPMHNIKVHELKKAGKQDTEVIEFPQKLPQKLSTANRKIQSKESRMFDVYNDKDKNNDGIDILSNKKNSRRTKITGKAAQKQLVIAQDDPPIKEEVPQEVRQEDALKEDTQEDAQEEVQEEDQEEDQEEGQEEGQGGSRRPSRSRKPVSYKWPSLSKKMRRQSEKFVDAVIVPDEEEPSADSYIKEESQSHNERKRTKGNDNTENNSSKRSKRQPLGNVTLANNNKTNSRKENADSKVKALNTNVVQDLNNETDKVVQSKMEIQIERDEKNDPSIFDFDDVYKPPKTYKKRKQGSTKVEKRTYENRRHSMLI